MLTQMLLAQSRLLGYFVAVYDCLPVLKLDNVVGCDCSYGLANFD